MATKLIESEAHKKLLRDALVALVGTDGRDELCDLAAVLKDIMPESNDKTTLLNAIQVLLDTLPEEGG